MKLTALERAQIFSHVEAYIEACETNDGTPAAIRLKSDSKFALNRILNDLYYKNDEDI